MAPATAEQTGQRPPPERWRAPPPDPRLGAGCVHVWRAELASVSGELTELLSAGEHARAERFARELDGRLWARGRGLLRALLGSYLGAEPRTLAFAEGANGKPALAGRQAPVEGEGSHEPGRDLSFNMSHSGGTALYAFSTTGAVGVDVELERGVRDTLALSARAFGASAAERLRGMEPAGRELEFLRMWVRHEAALKCLGTGLGAMPEAPLEQGMWILELDMGPRAAAAVALEARPCGLRCWTWAGGAAPAWAIGEQAARGS